MTYFNEAECLEHQIKNGADKLLAKAKSTSLSEPFLAVAQLLLAAATLAKTAGNSEEEFTTAFSLAMREVYHDNQSSH